jgi:hypothetical protein
MWNEELSRLIIFNVKREGDQRKLLKEQLEQEISEDKNLTLVEIPSYDPIDNESNTFMGRLVLAIINITKCSRNVIYIPVTNSWYTYNGDIAFSSKTLSYLIPAIGHVGINGLDKLISYNLQKELNKLNRVFFRGIDAGTKKSIDAFIKGNVDIMKIDENTRKEYENLLLITKNLYNSLVPIITKIGHLQLIRKVLLQELSFLSKVDSKGLYQTIENVNKSMVLKLTNPKKEEITDNEEYEVQKETELKELEFMEEISKYSDVLGISNPFNKIYTIFKYDLPFYATVLSLVVIGTLPSMVFEKKYACIWKKTKQEPIDGQQLIAGIITILNHCHSNYIKEFLGLLCQYGKSSVTKQFSGNVKAAKELPTNVITLMAFFDEFCKYVQMPFDYIQKYMSSFFCNSYH